MENFLMIFKTRFSLFILIPLILIFSVGCSESVEQKQAQTNIKPSSISGDSETLKKFNCINCHSLDGSKGIGPSFKGFYGTKVTITENGKEKEVIADEAYIKESIVSPNTKVTKGYQPTMPETPGIAEEEINEIIKEIRELK